MSHNKTYPYLYTYQDYLKFYFSDNQISNMKYHNEMRNFIRANGGVITDKMIEINPFVKDFLCTCCSCGNKTTHVYMIGPSYSDFGDDDYGICEDCLSKSYQLMKKTQKNIKMNLMSNFDDITEFQGEYRWLSNFSPCSIYMDGEEYRSVEHAYMAAKSDSKEWRDFCINTESPGFIKKESKKLSVKHNWDVIKLEVMSKCLTQKFNQEPYRSKLIETGDRHIQEGNRWGDTFWGVDLKTGKGSNMLGTLIMNIRSELIKQSKNVKPIEETPLGTDFAEYMKTGKLPTE